LLGRLSTLAAILYSTWGLIIVFNVSLRKVSLRGKFCPFTYISACRVVCWRTGGILNAATQLTYRLNAHGETARPQYIAPTPTQGLLAASISQQQFFSHW